MPELPSPPRVDWRTLFVREGAELDWGSSTLRGLDFLFRGGIALPIFSTLLDLDECFPVVARSDAIRAISGSSVGAVGFA